MYRICLDNNDNQGERTLYYPGDPECIVINPVVKLAVGQAGSCEFTLPPINPLYNAIYNRKSMISVYRGNNMIFCGEVRESAKDKQNCKKIYAIGELAFLFDSIQPQYDYGIVTPTAFMTAVLAEHNNQVEARKQFVMGTCSVSQGYDASNKVTDYDDTLTALRENLVNNLDGCLRVRHANGNRYLDFVPLYNYGLVNSQGINFGENLLDYAENWTSSDIATEVIPLGARLPSNNNEGFEKRLDIKSVNQGRNYVSIESAVTSFGHVRRKMVFEGIEDAQTLRDAGLDWLSKNQYETMTLKISAVDLSALDSSLDDMNLGDQIPCYAPPYGLNITLPILEQTLHLTDPSKDTIVLSASMKNKRRTISGQVGDSSGSIKQEVRKEELKIRAVIAREVGNILRQFTGSEGGHRLEEYDEDGLWLRTSYMNGTSKATSTKIMEFSMDGIRFFNGTAGQYIDPTKWKTAWTIGGDFCADFIVSGTMLAERIYGGILASADSNHNFTLNLENGAVDAKKLSVTSPNFTLTESGNVTASNASLTGATITGGEIVQSSGSETMTIGGAVIRGKRGNADVGYIDLSADTDTSDGALEYDAVIGSNSTLRLEFYRQIDIVDKYNNTLVGYFDGNGWHGPIDESFLPEPTVIYVNNGGNNSDNGNNNGGGN